MADELRHGEKGAYYFERINQIVAEEGVSARKAADQLAEDLGAKGASVYASYNAYKAKLKDTGERRREADRPKTAAEHMIDAVQALEAAKRATLAQVEERKAVVERLETELAEAREDLRQAKANVRDEIESIEAKIDALTH
ncbi:MAG: hypothetical protein J2O48_11660 [Solirubrobacterales bacterium]|nr:hypothetical protein [Solirubrobacterales bacterium]